MIAAGYLRLAHPELTAFAQDQARDAYVASGIVSGRSFPVLGVEVAGSAHTWGPLYFYMLAVPFAVSRDPSLAVAVLGVLTLASVWLLYRVGSAFFGPAAGIIAAALFATYPRIVIAETALTNVAPVPLFTLVFFHCLFTLVARRRSVMIVPALAALAVLVQMHLSTLSLGVVLCLVVALFRPRVRLVHLAAGLASALCLVSPYLVAQGLSGLHDVRTLYSGAAEGHEPRGLWELGRLADDILRIFPDLMMTSLGGSEAMRRSALALCLTRLETWLLLAGSAFVVATSVVQAFRRREHGRRQTAYTLVALWLVVPIAIIGQKAVVVAHHFELLYSAIFLAAAALVSCLLDGVTRVAPPRAAVCGRIAVYVLLICVVISQLDFHRQLWQAVRAQGAMVWRMDGTGGPFELMPIHYKERIVRTLVQDFRIDQEGFFHRVHGSRFRDLLDDKGYFFAVLERATGREEPSAASGRHYAIDRDGRGGPTIPGERTVSVGPYTIREYVPLIDYTSWQCAYETGMDGAGSGVKEGWLAVRLPTAGAPDLAAYWTPPPRSWRSLPVQCRGSLTRSPTASGSPPHLTVSLRTSAPGSHRIASFLLNGNEIAPRHSSDHAAFGAHSRDVVFDVIDHLRPGPNAISLRIEGRGLQFDLDVYEGGG